MNTKMNTKKINKKEWAAKLTKGDRVYSWFAEGYAWTPRISTIEEIDLFAESESGIAFKLDEAIHYIDLHWIGPIQV